MTGREKLIAALQDAFASMGYETYEGPRVADAVEQVAREQVAHDTAGLPPLKFFEVREGTRLAVCYRCGCVIVDDDERANRGDHEAWHEAVEGRAAS